MQPPALSPQAPSDRAMAANKMKLFMLLSSLALTGD
jgi:hypothetical protein